MHKAHSCQVEAGTVTPEMRAVFAHACTLSDQPTAEASKRQDHAAGARDRYPYRTRVQAALHETAASAARHAAAAAAAFARLYRGGVGLWLAFFL